MGWLDVWVREEAQAHNLDKLRASGLGEQHLFVLLSGFTPPPDSVALQLMRDGAPLPSRAPALPGCLSDVWVMSTWNSGDVFHFGKGGWTRYSKTLDPGGEPG